MSEDERLDWQELGYDPDKLPTNRFVRQDLMKYARKEKAMPRWQQLTGIRPGFEYDCSPRDRRIRVRKLVFAAKWLVRKEFKAHVEEQERSERTAYWTPLPEICHILQIARSKLSSFCVELLGISAQQMVDCTRAEQVTIPMRDALRAFLKTILEKRKAQHGDTEARSNTELDKELTPHPSPLPETGRGGRLDRWAVWKALKRSRRQPDFAYTTWAMQFGFSSYARFYRACIIVHGKTPHQLEMEIIDELLKETADAPALDHRAKPEVSMEQIEAALKELLRNAIAVNKWEGVRIDEPAELEARTREHAGV
jgi:hypothetical protein